MTTPVLAPAGHACWQPNCTTAPLAQWQRRLTGDELAAALATEQARRDEILALADPELPPPDLGPMPTAADYTRAVHSCGVHAITLDLAARVHEGACTAPTGGLLPACACKPEPLPEPTPASGEQPTTTLPSGWVVPVTEAP